MALLSNINDKFAVDSTGAIQFNGQVGTSGYVLKSNANAAPTWVDPSTVIGGPYLPLSGGTLSGATATAAGISFTVGGTLTGTTATFNTGAGDIGLAVYTSAISTTPNVRFGRNANEYIGFQIQDRNNRIVFRQDETTGNHEAVFDLWSSTTGNKAFVFGVSNSAGASFLNWLTIENVNATFAGTVSAVGASTFTLNDGVFIKAVNGTNNIASTNVWGYGLYEGASKLGEISLVRDGSSSQMYMGTTGANQVLRIGSGNKVTALTIDASQNATFAGNQVTVDPASGDATLQLQSSTQTLRLDQNSIRTTTNSDLNLFTNGNTNQLFLDQGTGNVGIGTSSTGEKLVIRETSDTAATRIKIEGGSYGFTLGKTTQAANYVHLRPGSNSPAVFRIMPNVGPNYSYMELWGTDFESNTTNYNRLMFYINGSTGDANIKINKAGSSPAGSLYIGTASSEQAITIVNSGNVGIGTTSPQALLDVNKTSSTIFDPLQDLGQRSGTATIHITNQDTTVGSFGQIMYDSDGSNQGIARIAFVDSGTASVDTVFVNENNNTKAETMRITRGGDIQIPINSASLQLRSSGSSSYTSIRRDSANQLIVANTAGNQVFGIGNGGELAISSGATYSAQYTYSNAWNAGYQTIILGSQLSPNSVYLITIQTNSFGTPPYYATTVFYVATSQGTNGNGGGNDNIAPTATHVSSNVYWKYRLSTIVSGRNGVEAWLVNGPNNSPINPTIYVKATKIMTI